MNIKVVAVVGAAIVGLVVGCKKVPADVAEFREGRKLDIMGKYGEAEMKYANAIRLGNVDALKFYGDMILRSTFDGVVTPVDSTDYIYGYDKWLMTARRSITKAEEFYNKASAAGCTNRLDESMCKLEQCKTTLADIEEKVAEAKHKEFERLAEIRRQEEEKEAERRRIAAEEAKKNSPEYCIENDLVMNATAFKEVVKEWFFDNNSGNELLDAKVNKEHRDRFAGQLISVSGKIRQVETTFFTDQVKCIIDVRGTSISARFDGMPKSEAMDLRRGQVVTIVGKLSRRPVMSDVAMDYCRFR